MKRSSRVENFAPNFAFSGQGLLVLGTAGRWLGLALSLAAVTAISPAAHAQSGPAQQNQDRPGQHPPDAKRPPPKRTQPETPPGAKKEEKGAEAPAPKPQAGPPTGPLASKPKPAEKVPQTADEKARLLGDLYAQLATAQDEAAAKRITDAIERLWLHSGSDTIDLLMERALRAINGKNTVLAQKLLDSAVSLAPDYPEAFNRRAYLNFTQNNYEGAVGDLRRVLALDPNHYKALEGLSQIWRETGNKKGALRIMKQLLDVNPYSSGVKQTYDELRREVDGQGI
jgi:tetratricopeptide (TPR) repeat protein